MARYRDIITGSAVIVISMVLFVLSFHLRDFAAVRLGPEFVPRLTAVAFGILGVILLVQGIINLRTFKGTNEKEEAGKEPAAGEGETRHAVIKSFLLLCGYIYLLDAIGFIIMTTLYLFIQMILLSAVADRRYMVFAVVSVLTSVSAYYLFVAYFRVMIPAGILG